MPPQKKRILIVAHDRLIRGTRSLLLEKAGYDVASVETDNEAMDILEHKVFDLILLGRKSRLPIKGLDQRLRERFPDLLTLKIEPSGEIVSIYPSRITDAVPEHVLEALKEMLDLQ
jgi:DNA-binding NtrC family response regulator